jgi:hypothetical protein
MILRSWRLSIHIGFEKTKNTVIKYSHAKKNFMGFLSIACAKDKNRQGKLPEGFPELALA